MQLYDNDHVACEKYQAIKNNRDGNYYDGISEWKRALPWLYYSDAPTTIREDLEIEMKMSFKAMSGYVQEMDYRLGKYSMNGTFIGFEKLSTQFTYCGRSAPDTEVGAGDTSSTKFLKFGTSQRESYSCDLETLETEEMFFYDMWVVDVGNTDCASTGQVAAEGLCLYPVPVLMRNLREDGVTPNLNYATEEETDDIFTRRFFLFDNLSGKKDGNLEVSGCASAEFHGVGESYFLLTTTPSFHPLTAGTSLRQVHGPPEHDPEAGPQQDLPPNSHHRVR